MDKGRIRDKAQDILFGAGVAEIATGVIINEENLTLVGLGCVIMSGLIERRKENG